MAEDIAEYRQLTSKQLAKKLADLEKQMYQHARDLEFEQAAKLRDKIDLLKQSIFQ